MDSSVPRIGQGDGDALGFDSRIVETEHDRRPRLIQERQRAVESFLDRASGAVDRGDRRVVSTMVGLKPGESFGTKRLDGDDAIIDDSHAAVVAKTSAGGTNDVDGETVARGGIGARRSKAAGSRSSVNLDSASRTKDSNSLT